MDKKEIILLDACLISVIDTYAFSAELSNGHRFVAYIGRDDETLSKPEVGKTATVEMSPFDMSKGRLVLDQEQ